MRIVTARRLSQTFFLLLFAWFAVVNRVGQSWWELRGWPVNWFLQLDPLVALSVLLTTSTIFRGLLWSLAVLAITLLLGRIFCGWVCPLGSLNQAIGYLGRRHQTLKTAAQKNRFHPRQNLKYYLLAFLLAAAGGGWLAAASSVMGRALVAGFAAAAFLAAAWSRPPPAWRRTLLAAVGAAATIGLLVPINSLYHFSVQSGLLDPLVLLHRSFNLVILPLVGGKPHFHGAWLVAAILAAVLLLNLRLPRFYCRFVCPLGALLGLCSRAAVWRLGKKEADCRRCRRCQRHCEGACDPADQIRLPECVLCFNCLDSCEQESIAFRALPSAAGEIVAPNTERRSLLLAIFSGLLAVPVTRLSGLPGKTDSPHLIRPPGALAEAEFLQRCLKCGQCMRVCPTAVIQPATYQAGLEGIWSPILDFTAGKSGCQRNCVACGHLCPTGAIRPLSPDEKLGRGPFAAAGPVVLGTAFVDRGRCLPWAMSRPCIVCQEVCPVSPKAINTREELRPVLSALAGSGRGPTMQLQGVRLQPGQLSGGDYYLEVEGKYRRQIIANSAARVQLAPGPTGVGRPEPGQRVQVLLRLLLPWVDPQRCVGCGICEHECPVSGPRAIRVSPANESRHPGKRFLVSPRTY